MRPVTWWGKTIYRLLQVLFAFIIVFPVLYAIDISFMPAQQIFRKPPNLMPKMLNLSNYKLARSNAPLFRYELNSLIVAVCVTAGQMALCRKTAGNMPQRKEGRQVRLTTPRPSPQQTCRR